MDTTSSDFQCVDRLNRSLADGRSAASHSVVRESLQLQRSSRLAKFVIRRVEESDEEYIFELKDKSKIRATETGDETEAVAAFRLARRKEKGGNKPENLVLKIELDPSIADAYAKLAHDVSHAGDYEEGREAVTIPLTSKEKKKIKEEATANPGKKVNAPLATRDVYDELRATLREQKAYGTFPGQTIDVDWVKENYGSTALVANERFKDVSGHQKVGKGKNRVTRREATHRVLESKQRKRLQGGLLCLQRLAEAISSCSVNKRYASQALSPVCFCSRIAPRDVCSQHLSRASIVVASDTKGANTWACSLAAGSWYTVPATLRASAPYQEANGAWSRVGALS
jgi:hypothetical protein